jgi:hypothetical protein
MYDGPRLLDGIRPERLIAYCHRHAFAEADRSSLTRSSGL